MQDKALANLLKALSTPRRIKIFKLLLRSSDPLMVSNIAALVGIQEGPASLNLSILADVGLVLRHISGRHVFYEVNRATLNTVLEFFGKEDDDEVSRPHPKQAS